MTTQERQQLRTMIDNARRTQLAGQTITGAERRLAAAQRIIERLKRRAELHARRADTWRDRYHRATAERDALWTELDARRTSTIEPYLTDGAREAARARAYRQHSNRRYLRSKVVG